MMRALYLTKTGLLGVERKAVTSPFCLQALLALSDDLIRGFCNDESAVSHQKRLARRGEESSNFAILLAGIACPV